MNPGFTKIWSIPALVSRDTAIYWAVLTNRPCLWSKQPLLKMRLLANLSSEHEFHLFDNSIHIKGSAFTLVLRQRLGLEQLGILITILQNKTHATSVGKNAWNQNLTCILYVFYINVNYKLIFTLIRVFKTLHWPFNHLRISYHPHLPPKFCRAFLYNFTWIP